jgi:hypothetical protein
MFTSPGGGLKTETYTMKSAIFTVLCVTAFILGCRSNDPKKFFSENKLFYLTPTTDPSFCNKDSIIATECGLDDVYFTTSGLVLYSPQCLDDDVQTYFFGSYAILDSAIVCTFESKYEYILPCIECLEEEWSNIDHNSGKVDPIETWILTIKETNCEEYPYYIAINNAFEWNLLTPEVETDYFCERISRVDALSQFHCPFDPSRQYRSFYDDDYIDEPEVGDPIAREIVDQLIAHHTSVNKEYRNVQEEENSILSLTFYENESDMPVEWIYMPLFKSDYLFGDLDMDSDEDVLVRYEGGAGGSASWGYLAVFLTNEEAYTLAGVHYDFDACSCPGETDPASFTPIEIANGAIIGETTCYDKDDARCCPSITKRNKVRYQNKQFVQD